MSPESRRSKAKKESSAGESLLSFIEKTVGALGCGGRECVGGYESSSCQIVVNILCNLFMLKMFVMYVTDDDC